MSTSFGNSIDFKKGKKISFSRIKMPENKHEKTQEILANHHFHQKEVSHCYGDLEHDYENVYNV